MGMGLTAKPSISSELKYFLMVSLNFHKLKIVMDVNSCWEKEKSGVKITRFKQKYVFFQDTNVNE